MENNEITTQPSIQQPKPQKIWLVLGLLLLISVSALIWWQWEEIVGLTKDQSQQAQPAINYEVQQVDHSILPQGLPADIPLEIDAGILQNEIITSTEGKGEQYVRKFVSQKSIAENFQIYQEYLKNNDWVVQSTINEENLKALIASNTEGSKKLFINISKNELTGQVTVDLSVIRQKVDKIAQ